MKTIQDAVGACEELKRLVQCQHDVITKSESDKKDLLVMKLAGDSVAERLEYEKSEAIAKVKTLESEIAVLKAKIDGLERSLDYAVKAVDTDQDVNALLHAVDAGIVANSSPADNKVKQNYLRRRGWVLENAVGSWRKGTEALPYDHAVRKQIELDQKPFKK